MKHLARLTPILILGTIVGPGASERPATGLQPKGADLELLRSVRRIAEEVERLRGESFVRPPVAVRAPDSMRKVAAEIRASNVIPRERLAARGRAWSEIGLGGSGSPERLFQTLAADLQGIGFDPDGNRLLVSPDRLTLDDYRPDAKLSAPSTVLMMTGVRPDEPLASHLLMHVRQRERAGRDSLQPTTDGLLAHSAWAEGEANLLAIRYLFEGMGLADDVIEYPLDPGDFLEGILVPPELDELSGVEQDLVRFVYIEGFAEAVRRFKAGGWAALDHEMARRPTSGAILHPDGPVESSFTRPSPPAPDLRLVDTDSLGEQGVIVLISRATGKDDLALEAGEGWTGDRLYRWESPGKTGSGAATEWRTRWRTAEDALDFAYAYGRTLAVRFPDRKLERGEGTDVLRTDARIFRVETAGREVRVLILPAASAP